MSTVSEKLSESLNGSISINPLLSEMLGGTKKIKKLTVSIKYLICSAVNVFRYITIFV